MPIELLAPAGNLEKLKIAILYGADAVYLAGQQFGLRTAAGNFSESEITEAVTFAHDRQKKVYIALNAFLHQAEIEQLPDFLQFLNDAHVDGVICSDMGVVDVAQRFSNIPIHISTQTSVLNSWHAQVWKDVGAKRIVVGRELSIAEAAEIKTDANIEIEMFVHGAMCMAYSGHCFLSNYTVERDANRGGCIQNCRFSYQVLTESGKSEEAYLLSSKDLCGIRLLNHFVDSGIDSLKIEGRMRSSLYVATTVRAYAQAIESLKKRPQPDLDFWELELNKIPNRGYTEGYLMEPAGPSSIFDAQANPTHQYKMAGMVLVLDAPNKRFAFVVKNKLKIGDKVEILLFAGQTVEIAMESFLNMADQELEVAQPNNVIWLPHKPGIEARNVGRILG